MGKGLLIAGGITLAGVIFIMLVFPTLALARGVRNNNPGNIRNNPSHQWPGQVGVDAKGFCIFLTPAYGLAALAKLILNYEYKKGYQTLNEFGDTYAPASDNAGSQYGPQLGVIMNMDPSTPFDFSKYLPEMMGAIVRQENGDDAYFDTTLKIEANKVLASYAV